MAHLFQPTYTRGTPAGSRPCRVGGVPAVRWTGRGGKELVGILSDDGTRCTVTVACWYLAYRDHHGRECKEKLFPDRRLSERRMHEILDRVDAVRAGAVPESAAPGRQAPLAELLDRWRQSIVDDGASEPHADQARHRAAATFAQAGIYAPVRIAAEAVGRALAHFRKAGVPRQEGDKRKPKPLSRRTSNHFLKACKAFAGWLVDTDHLAADPLSRARALPVDGHETFVRRTIDAAELETLMAATVARKARCALAGPDRAMAYYASFYTGFRLNEVAALAPEMFRFAEPPAVILPARLTLKGKRDATQYLPRHAADRLRAYLADKPEGVPVWGYAANFFAGKKAAAVLRRDLAAAGIPAKTAAGVLDFHAIRTSYITALFDAGVPIHHAQKLARHTDPRLTMQHYARSDEEGLAASAARLKPPEG